MKRRRWIVPAVLIGGWLSVPGPGLAAESTDDASVRLKLATSLLHAGQYDQAIAEFQRVLDQEPENRDAILGMARAGFWSGRPEQALRVLEPLLVDGGDAETSKLWNQALAAGGNLSAALEAIDRRLEREPDNTLLLRSRANLLVANGCFAKGIDILRELREGKPGSLPLALDLAHAYFTADRHPEAIETYRPHGRDSDSPELAALLGEARSLLDVRDIAEAVVALQAASALKEHDPRANLGLLTAWVMRAEAVPAGPGPSLDALSDAHNARALRAQASVRGWLFRLVAELVARDRTDERTDLAGSLADLLPGTDDDPALHLCTAALRQYVEDGPEGVVPDSASLLQGVTNGTVERGPFLEVGDVLLWLGQGQKLAELCQAWLERHDQVFAVRLLLAEALAVSAEYEDAEEAYRQVLADLPECTKARRGLARVLSWYRLFDESEEVYDELIERDPDDLVIRREAARMLGWDKQLKSCLRTYDDLLPLTDEIPSGGVWNERLTLERQAKPADWWVRNRQAVKKYRELIALEPSNQEARFDLAQVYARNRLWEEAAEQYQELLNIDSRHRRARDALYKNTIYHHPELIIRFDRMREQGRGDLVDIHSLGLTEILKTEIARRTDLSIINRQIRYDFHNFGGSDMARHDLVARLDHRFDLNTWGHISSGWVMLDGTQDPDRWIADAEITHRVTDWLGLTLGFERLPWVRNRATLEQGLDWTRFYIGAFGDISPWLDWWIEYGHGWIEGDRYWRTVVQGTRLRRVKTSSRNNQLDDLDWGARYRFSLFPKILQLEYRGFAWFFEHEAPTYFSPESFVVNEWRLAWRHYLNTDQYVEQKKLYYEFSLKASVDSDHIWGGGYGAELGWDISHHLEFRARWESFNSSTYDTDFLGLEMRIRF